MYRFLMLALVFASVAHAQPQASSCYSPSRAGWVGPYTSLGCHVCCGCRDLSLTMEWQLRFADAGWTGAEMTYSIDSRFAGNLRAPLTHLESYCMRMRYVDGVGPGAWGPSNLVGVCGVPASDLCFDFDDSPPSVPTNVALTNSGNQIIVTFNASNDDGGGVDAYRLSYFDSSATLGFGEASGSPVRDMLGAGTWQVGVYAIDRADNSSGASMYLPITLGADASIPVPPAPTWAAPVTNINFVPAFLTDDGAESWLITQRRPDGGWRVSARPRVATPEGLMDVSGPCNRNAVRVASVFGNQVSNWSAPSADLLTDTVTPIANAPSVGVDGGLAFLTWPAASDACPSGLTYSVQRSVNGGAFVTRTTLGALATTDALDTEGLINWRIVARDGAGNQGTSAQSGNVRVVFDAGQPDSGTPDAGEEPDAGTPDAGEPDAGSEELPPPPRVLTVGCGCSSAEFIAFGAFGALLLRRRRKSLEGGRARVICAVRIDERASHFDRADSLHQVAEMVAVQPPL